jgi:hypothetical protein
MDWLQEQFARALLKFVEKEKRWPDSWEELLIPSEAVESYKSRVSVEFGLLEKMLLN